MAFNYQALKRLRLASLMGSIFSLFFISEVAAQSEPIVLSTEDSGLSVVLPATAFQEGHRLAVEIDGYDVTAFARIEGTNLILQLDTPLPKGTHYLTVLLFLPNGNIETLVERSLTVRLSTQTNTQWYANSSFINSYRAGEKEESQYQGISHSSANGSLEAGSNTTNGRWQLDTRLQSMYDSVSENNPPHNNEWVIPDYRVATSYTGDRLMGALAVGNVYVADENLLFSNFNKRGAEAELNDQLDTFRLKIFGVNSEPTTRYDGDHGIPSRGERTSGGTGTVSLADEYFQLSVGYVAGETTLGGAGVGGFEDATVYGGDSWNLGMDSRWLQNSLWLHLEYAESSFDSDGLDFGADAEKDSATSAFLQLSSTGSLGSGWFDYWTGRLRYQTVGSDFFSMGNLYLPGDLESNSVLMQASKGNGGVQGEWSRERNNVDDNPHLPEQTLTRKGVLVSYANSTSETFRWLWDVVGAPSSNVSLYRTNHSQPLMDSLAVGYDLDNETDETSVALTFSQPTWNWGVQYQIVDRHDYSIPIVFDNFILYEPPSDTRNRLTSLNFGWVPSNRASISASLQWNTFEETDADNTFRTRNYNIDSFLRVIPDKLTLLVNYNLGRDQSRYGINNFFDDDRKNQSGNVQLSWHAMDWRPQRPAIDVYLKGLYGKQEGRAFNLVNEQWSAYLGMQIQFAKGDRL
ncbi:MAG: hypothetical protein WDZ30_04510 [Cellvibrionaceae bacterium]